MQRPHRPFRCRDYDKSRNDERPTYDAADVYALLVFRQPKSLKGPLPVTMQTTTKPSNGLGTAGFVVGLVGLVLSFIPLIEVVAWPLVILGIVFSSVGIAKASKGRATNKGLAIAGLVASVVGLAICILWAALWGKAVNDVTEEANREAVIVYEITGDAPSADVTYTTFGTTTTTNQETITSLPWTKEVKTTGLVKEGQLIVTTGADGGSVTCKITVDGKEVKTATASGAFSMASCDSL